MLDGLLNISLLRKVHPGLGSDAIYPILRAARDVVVQNYGRTHAWAGMWVECGDCKTMFAFGGNWNEHHGDDLPQVCPTCNLGILLKQLENQAKDL